ncbi:MAG: cation:proton antiporter [Methanomicrobiales archaeon]|nr:cation:proton antiporter [Methanomicrobiales archaeon]
MSGVWISLDVWFPVVGIFLVFIALCTVRLFRGPTPADRAVAVDTVNTLTVAIMVLLGVAYQQIIFVDVAIVYAVLSFVSTLYIAKYLGGEM